jgi:hypothetical protein
LTIKYEWIINDYLSARSKVSARFYQQWNSALAHFVSSRVLLSPRFHAHVLGIAARAPITHSLSEILSVNERVSEIQAWEKLMNEGEAL